MAPGEELTCVTCRAVTPSRRSAVLASYLGWTVDAFDSFILVFVMNIAKDFGIRRAPAHRQNDEETRQFWYANSPNSQNGLKSMPGNTRNPIRRDWVNSCDCRLWGECGSHAANWPSFTLPLL